MSAFLWYLVSILFTLLALASSVFMLLAAFVLFRVIGMATGIL